MAGDAKYGRLFTEEDVRVMLLTAYDWGLDDGSGGAVDHRLPASENERGQALLTAALAHDFAPTLPADEPLFLLRGQDAVTGPTVAAYTLGLINMDGMTEADPHVQAAQAARLRIEQWQREHPERVKAPD